MTKLYYDADADLSLLHGRRIAVIGYGSQGHAHALNLKESGCDVVVGVRPGSEGWARAEADGWQPQSPADAVVGADIIGIFVPDHIQVELWNDVILPALGPRSTVLFAHGFNIHFGTIVPPKDVDVIMVAPKGPGHLVRRLYSQGEGVPALIAMPAGRDRRGAADSRSPGRRASAARAPGCSRRRSREETVTDLFGEQAVLCGGASALVQAGFETLVDGRLPARDRVLRVPARAEADRRPDVRGRARRACATRSPTPPSTATSRAARRSSTPTCARRCSRSSRTSRAGSSRGSSSARTRPAAPSSRRCAIAARRTRSSRSARSCGR